MDTSGEIDKMTSYVPVKLAFYTVEPDNFSKEEAPIIFLHGVTVSKEHWKDIPRTVADETKRKVYVVDARNHGDSEWSDIFNFDCNVDDLLHFMDSHDIPKAVIVGHSMGGLTGIKTALRSAERVERLVVEDINVRSSLPKDILEFIVLLLSLSKAALQQVPQNATEQEAKKFIIDYIFNGFPTEIQNLTSKSSFDDFPFLLKGGPNGRFASKANIDVIWQAMKDMEKLITEPVGVYEGPTTFIYGTISSFLVGSDELNTRKFFPNVEFTPIENATHGVHTDHPKEFTEALVKFLLNE